MDRIEHRRALWERDQRLCGICGQPVLYADLDLDHIVPRMLDGDDTDANLRASHRTCNRRRGGQDRAMHRRRPRPVIVTVSTGLPPDLHERIVHRAEDDLRSVNAEIQWLLLLALDVLDEREHGG